MKKIVYIHGLGGGMGSRIPNILREIIGDQYEIIKKFSDSTWNIQFKVWQ